MRELSQVLQYVANSAPWIFGLIKLGLKVLAFGMALWVVIYVVQAMRSVIKGAKFADILVDVQRVLSSLFEAIKATVLIAFVWLVCVYLKPEEVTKRAAPDYAFAKKGGDQEEACRQARLLAEAHKDARNLEEYKKWVVTRDEECAKVQRR